MIKLLVDICFSISISSRATNRYTTSVKPNCCAMETTFHDVLLHHGLLRKLILSKLSALGQECSSSSSSSNGLVSSFRLTSKVCLASSYDTDILRIKAFKPPSQDDPAWAAFDCLLLKHGAVTTLDIVIPADCDAAQTDLTVPVAHIHNRLPNLVELWFENNSSKEHVLPQDVVVQFQSLDFLFVKDFSFEASPLLPPMLETLWLQGNPKQHLEANPLAFTLDLSALRHLIEVNLFARDDICVIQIPHMYSNANIITTYCQNLTEIIGVSETCSVGELTVSNCNALYGISNVVGLTTTCLTLVDLNSLCTPELITCVVLTSLTLKSCLNIRGVLDLQDMVLIELEVVQCPRVTGVLLSGNPNLTRLVLKGLDMLPSLDLTGLQLLYVVIDGMDMLSCLKLNGLKMLDSIDVSQCPDLDMVFDVSESSLITSLSLGNCRGISNIRVSKDSSLLKNISVRRCVGFGSILDLSCMPSLTNAHVIGCAGVKTILCGSSHPLLRIITFEDESLGDSET